MTGAPPPAELPETTSPVARAGGVAAASVISEFLRVQGDVAPRSAMSRVFGRSPLSSDSRPWYLGSLGELEVAERLSRLSPEWTVLHSVPVGTRGSDIDHLVIGPGGVFTINTKFHEDANVWLGTHRLLVNGQKTDHLRNARFEASRVAKLLTRVAHAPVSASGIVALVGVKQITVKNRPTDVPVLRDSELIRWLHTQPEVLAPDFRVRLARIATNPSTWGGETLVPDLAAFGVIRRTVEGARRVRLAWGFALLLLVPASTLGLSTRFFSLLG
ncbi:NERD domain-containing protein [Microbacterium sp.]|uniref:NERD domain-containing protein n=1 Tax=Microbacterium sp. TaxID=51671 RepID=UPI002C87D39B|nr:NERD domain-containing protein [Microbacterium sp.]HWK76739.1 NERD domain-containing protein [Microbacterium sp.]